MEWVNIIVSAIGTIVGMVGGGVGIFFWKANRALKAAEAESKQAEVKDQLVKVELQEAEEWNKLYKEEREKNAEKSARLRSLYASNDKKNAEIMRLRFECERRNWYRCTVDGCPNRRPPHRFDEHGVELAAADPILSEERDEIDIMAV